VQLELPAIEVPPVFGWLATAGGVVESELLRTFNCGVGMIVIAGADMADRVADVLRHAGECPFALGEVIAAPDGERVRSSGALRL
jgi:phosphoribosylformylglycinamidine cyclo-ligase